MNNKILTIIICILAVFGLAWLVKYLMDKDIV